MINVQELENTIRQLEDGDTTFASCQKLADLYTVRDHLQNTTVVTEELADILPSYKKYCDTKRRFQLGEISENFIDNALKNVCREINEFLLILYNNTDSKVERDIIKTTLSDVVLHLS